MDEVWVLLYKGLVLGVYASKEVADTDSYRLGGPPAGHSVERWTVDTEPQAPERREAVPHG